MPYKKMPALSGGFEENINIGKLLAFFLVILCVAYNGILHRDVGKYASKQPNSSPV